MQEMKAVQVSEPRKVFEVVTRPVPEPKPREVRICVEACGICHSDQMVHDGLWPGLSYPRIPGHEVAGRIDQVGEGVTAWKVGERVGAGWYGGHCSVCDACRAGDFINCRNGEITGFTRDGGYAEYMVARQESLARIPESLSAAEAGPLLCAGITTFNSLRNSGARAGDLVAVLGVGGLGHLGVQFAARMGFRTVAISGGKDKEELARKLGASHYIDSGSTDAAKELQKMGGAQVILATAPSGKLISGLLKGLTRRGKLLIVAAAHDPMTIPATLLLSGRQIAGWPSGVAKDSEDTLNFSAATGARPMIETFPLEKAAEAYAQMLSNRARFRVVLTVQ